MENYKNIIHSNANSEGGTFMYNLRSESFFDKGQYNEMVFAIAQLNKQLTNAEERSVLAVEIWEICFLIQCSLFHDLNPRDVFSIPELSEEKKGELSKDLHTIGNFFSYKRELDFRDYLL